MENNSTYSGHIEWNWKDFCPTGLTPFAVNSNDLLPCYQKICLQMPTYTIFAALSAYSFGSFHLPVLRNATQIRLINTRTVIAIILALLPIGKVFHQQVNYRNVYPIDLLIVCTQCVMWIVHCGYLLSLRRYGNLNHRGSLFVNVVWTTIFALDVVWLRTSLRFSFWPWSLAVVIMDTIYLLTFIPSGSAAFLRPSFTEDNEYSSLLGNRYVQFNTEFNEMTLGYAQDEANFVSKLLFYWVNPLIVKGMSGHLRKIEDLFDLPDCLNIVRISDRLQTGIYRTSSLFWALHRTFGREFYLIGIFRFIADVSGFAGPLLLGGLLRVQTVDAGTDIQPYLYALGLFASTLIAAFCGTHFNWRMSIVSMKMRIGVVSTIYRKALEAKGLQDARSEILNLMSTDTDRIVNSCVSFHSFWSIPFQLFTTLYLLYTQIGAAFIAGLIFAVTLIPINRWLAVRIGLYSEGLMTSKDARLSATGETINGAKQIKLHAWEDIFINKINKLRKTEVQFLSKRKYLDALCVYFWATTPVLMCLLTFGVSTLLGNPLDASRTYTSVALLNMLIGPLNTFPWVLNGLIEAWVSVKRVQELIGLPNSDFSAYYSPLVRNLTNTDEKKLPILQLKDATFEHQLLTQQESNFVFRLERANLQVNEGDLICIEGPVGGGKSTLISAIIAGTNCIEGQILVNELNSGFGYVPQSPWLQRGTIRENIVWGSGFDESRYTKVIHACALSEDFETLGGDLIGVGENGRTLSGGQRARISLARAVYQEKKIYLIDDILASLDAHVANHVIKFCILGLLKNQTRIVVTSNRTLFYNANQIIHVESGLLTPSEYMSESFDLSFDDHIGDNFEEHTSIVKMSSINLIDNDNDDKKSLDSIMMEESREYGNLSINVISTYWKAMSKSLGLLVIFFVILMQITRNMSDAWLAYWVTETNVNSTSGANTSIFGLEAQEIIIGNQTDPVHSLSFYLGIYSALAVSNSIITLVRSFVFAYAGIKAAKFIHDNLLRKVVYATFSFFDITSVGRILNRFSSDVYTIDDSLPFILNILLAQVVGLTGAVCVSLYAMPWLGLIIIPMVPVYINLQHRYRHASRDIKRLSSNALSPLYTHFTETLQGLTTIRAMRACARFQRDFHIKLEESIKAQLTTSAAQQWLALRLQLLGSVLVGGAGLLAAITSTHVTNPGMVGLAISYALSITSLLGGVLNAFAETEQEMVAVERVEQYLQLQEENNFNGTCDPPFGWPNQGAVTFRNVSLKYRDHLQLAITNLTLSTGAFERIAIVGRTGAGKSSILAALLRVAPLSTGEISIDCMNVKALSLRVLRERISVITQEPFLFEGTVRDNLDPRRKFIDSEIWNAITNCLSTPLIQSIGGLEGRLEKGGANLSAGQRQLLCLTRALLKNSKVVCIDEGTSNLDSDSEAAIQIALRNSFKSSTILFIAHRLKGLQNMDRILVMENGKIVEQGTPRHLGENKNSIFYSMLQIQRNEDYSNLVGHDK